MRPLLRLALATLALAAAAGRAPAAEELDLFAWSEYVPQEVLDGFTRETGVRVNYETYASNEEMLAKLVSGAASYDLIQPSEYTVEALRTEDRLLKLDHAKLPNLKNIGPEYRGLPHDPGLDYSVPYMQGTVGIVVNTEKVKEPIAGYADVFQPKHKNRIVVLDDPLEIVTWAMATRGLGPDEVTRENLAKVRPVLEQWLPLVKVYDSDSPKTALLNGDVDLGVVWSGEAALLPGGLQVGQPDLDRWGLLDGGSLDHLQEFALGHAVAGASQQRQHGPLLASVRRHGSVTHRSVARSTRPAYCRVARGRQRRRDGRSSVHGVRTLCYT